MFAHAHADFQNEQFLRQSVLLFQVVEQIPEFYGGFRDTVRLIAVGLAARQCLFVALAGRFFPVLQALPVEPVEFPHDACAKRPKVLEIDPALANA